MTPAVTMTEITKEFGPVRALDSVSLSVQPGSIHAVVGENGAGKTTLMRVLYGAIPATSGSYELNGQPVRYRSSKEAIRAGIGMVSQHYSIIPELTCIQNLMLGAEPGWIASLGNPKKRAQELAERMGFEFEWDALAEGLGPARSQKLEILKLLWRESKILILDEPTAMLSPSDGDRLYESLRQLASEGAAVIVVTHRLSEVMEHCSRATVLRAGKKVADVEVAEATTAQLTELIVGHEMPEQVARPPVNTEPLLQVDGLSVKGDRGHLALIKATFEVRRGEVLGLAGVDGGGQRELVHALLGLASPTEGWIRMGGELLTGLKTRERLAMGMRAIPEDRHYEAVIEEWSLEENAALGGQWMPPFARGKAIATVERREAANRIGQRFSTKFASISQPISGLSGGNQQRFVNGRALCTTPRAVIAFQPARGLDVDATRRFYAGLYEECANGAAALVVSCDLDELLEYCDRILAINRGVIRSPEPGKEKDRQEIGRLMVAEE